MNSQLPDCIAKLVAGIQSVGSVDNEILSELINRADLSETALRAYNSFNHSEAESYGRSLLFENEKFKILLMSWRPNDFTAIHNHGHTDWGCVHFFGNATHRLYTENDGILELNSRDYFEEGQNAAVCGNLIHLMGNSGPKEFVTLHIYGSDTRLNAIPDDTEVFLPEFREKVATAGTAFLNMDKSLKKSETFFNSLTETTLLDYLELIKPFYFKNHRMDILQEINRFEKNTKEYYH
jgi:cysteine dioxygenase